MKPFTKQVIQIIKSVPPGKVMAYGQVARAAGSPRAARQVVRILHSMSEKYNLPWHRIVNKEGRIVLKEESGLRQRDLLEHEGVDIGLDGRIDMEKYQFHPDHFAIENDDFI